jgi:hypothetical protein
MVQDDQGMFVRWDDVAALRAEWEEELEPSIKRMEGLIDRWNSMQAVDGIEAASDLQQDVERLREVLMTDATTEQGGEQSGS